MAERRDPITRAISRTAYELRKGGEGYRYILPADYASHINRANIKRAVKRGESLRKAIVKELEKQATVQFGAFDASGNPTGRVVTKSGKEGREIIEKVQKWNKTTRALTVAREGRGLKSLIDQKQYTINLKTIKNLDKVEKMTKGTNPLDLALRRKGIAIENYRRTLRDQTNLPKDVQNAMIAAFHKMSPKELSDFMSTRQGMPIKEWYEDHLVSKNVVNYMEDLIKKGYIDPKQKIRYKKKDVKTGKVIKQGGKTVYEEITIEDWLEIQKNTLTTS